MELELEEGGASGAELRRGTLKKVFFVPVGVNNRDKRVSFVPVARPGTKGFPTGTNQDFCSIVVITAHGGLDRPPPPWGCARRPRPLL